MFEPEYTHLVNYLKKQCSDKEQKLIENWIHSSADNQLLFDEIQEIWNTREDSEEDYHPDLEKSWNRILRGINPTRSIAPSTIKWAMSIAASVALLIIFIIKPGPLIEQQLLADCNHIYIADSAISIMLPDSSEIWLNAGSKLGLNEGFNQQSRNVVLRGEAYFKVRRDTTSTFNIATRNALTSVLGTSFIINQKNKNTEINVFSGKVKFGARKGKNKAILLAGDKSVCTKNNEPYVTKSTNANLLSWYTKNFVFANEAFHEICTTLEHAYGINIEIKGNVLKNKKLTVSFYNQSISEVVNVLQQTMQCKIKRKNNTYIFH